MIDDLLSERTDNQTLFRLTDHLGSLRKLIDSNQTITESIDYTAFGTPATASSSHFLFTGRGLDPEASLYHYRARTYHPFLERFTSKDPLLFIDGPNVYGYVFDNPVNLRDPLGLVGEQQVLDQCRSSGKTVVASQRSGQGRSTDASGVGAQKDSFNRPFRGRDEAIPEVC